jgi:hypothetical protein
VLPCELAVILCEALLEPRYLLRRQPVEEWGDALRGGLQALARLGEHDVVAPREVLGREPAHHSLRRIFRDARVFWQCVLAMPVQKVFNAVVEIVRRRALHIEVVACPPA